jgi:hypothetical protein
VSFVDFVVEIHRTLARAGMAHAFGGALALAYAAEPRGTVDVDVNVFSPVDDLDTVLGVFGEIDLRPEEVRARWVPIAGIRLRGDDAPYPVDLFASLDDRYAEVEARTVIHPFGPDNLGLPFLSPEDLAVFKLSFGREKDWVDLRSIAAWQRGLDPDYVERQLVGLRGPGMYPRLTRFRRLLREERG